MELYDPTPSMIRNRRRQLEGLRNGKCDKWWSMKRLELIIDTPISVYMKRPIRSNMREAYRKD